MAVVSNQLAQKSKTNGLYSRVLIARYACLYRIFISSLRRWHHNTLWIWFILTMVKMPSTFHESYIWTPWSSLLRKLDRNDRTFSYIVSSIISFDMRGKALKMLRAFSTWTSFRLWEDIEQKGLLNFSKSKALKSRYTFFFFLGSPQSIASFLVIYQNLHTVKDP